MGPRGRARERMGVGGLGGGDRRRTRVPVTTVMGLLAGRIDTQVAASDYELMQEDTMETIGYTDFERTTV